MDITVQVEVIRFAPFLFLKEAPVKKEAIMRIVRLLEKEGSIRGFSNHFLSIARK